MSRHGGQCVAKNKCKCLPEWKGRYCTKREYFSPKNNILQGNQTFHPPQLGVQEVAGTEAGVWLRANADAPMDSLARPVALQPPIDQN